MYIEKLVAGVGVTATALLLWRAGTIEVARFIAVVSGYAHHCDVVSAWGY